MPNIFSLLLVVWKRSSFPNHQKQRKYIWHVYMHVHEILFLSGNGARKLVGAWISWEPQE
jgi:hypothetical protein